MEELKIAIIKIDPGRDASRRGIRSAKVQHVCVMIFSCQPRSVRLFNGCALVKKMLQKLPCINRLLKELPNRICKEKYDARRRFPFSILCNAALCDIFDRHTRPTDDQKCLRHLASAMLTCYANCPKRDIIVITADVRYFLHTPCPFSTRRPYVTLRKCVRGIWNCLDSMLARRCRMRPVRGFAKLTNSKKKKT